MNSLQKQVDDLETKLSFQELTIEELNQEIIRMNDLLAHQQHQLQFIVQKLRETEPSNMATQAEETPPPHY
ncbi:SlyX family protein [Parashewanella spongiae]|uniref:Protein SlyX homolog n=1 Tax=Parashewanella spongiae TaxID=342950 RepID=A0A3A6TEN8_9GAMM|nr:SlyX family protein [Parashewanella spongiae]MCL1079350.1 SlyX family protein [Parashewanella spongiae]RJY11491.1 SlyX family protein [Parashewanella spongiae]